MINNSLRKSRTHRRLWRQGPDDLDSEPGVTRARGATILPPRLVDEVGFLEGAVGDSAEDCLPFTDDSAFSVRVVWPIRPGDRRPAIDGLPGDGVKGVNVGQERP